MSRDTWTVAEIRRAIQAGEISAVEVCRIYLDRIMARNTRLNAFLRVTSDRALARAAAIDSDPDRTRKPLAGVPIAIKDNMCTKDVPTTAGSNILHGFVPPYSATVVDRLERAGAIIVGKTNCDEFAMGSSTEHSAFGPTRNPWAHDRIPGGSSGGSAAAVAARLAPAALASDTGGSIRQPAALCGVVGFKPTYGRVSRYGLIAFASSLDQIGPIALTVRDAALVLSVIAGPDPHDATAAMEPVPDFTASVGSDIRGARIGVPRAVIEEGIDAEVMRAYTEALALLGRHGARLIDIDLPHAPYAIPAYYLVAPAEASSNLARYDGVRYGCRALLDERDASVGTMYDRTRDRGFGPEVKRRIMLGTYALSAGYYEAYYRKAQQVRMLIRQDYDRAFERVDAVAMPTSPCAAFKLGERADDPLQMYLTDVFTVSANLTGLPALNVPCGFTAGRLPIGFQFIGRPFDEATLLKLADAYEREAPWWQQAPQS